MGKTRELSPKDTYEIVENVAAADNVKNEEIRISFATRLNELMTENQITQKEIVIELNISAGQVSKYINGKQEPRLWELSLLADLFDVSIDYLSGRSDTKKYEYDDIHKSLGLTETTIKKLWFWKQQAKEENKKNNDYTKCLTIFNLLFDSELDLLLMLENIDDYIKNRTMQLSFEKDEKSLEEQLKDNDGTIKRMIANDNVILSKFKVQEALFSNVDKIINSYNSEMFKNLAKDILMESDEE